MGKKEENQPSRSSCLPVRYRLALMSLAVVSFHSGIRKSLALILTHITTSDLTQASEDIVFTNCTVFNTSRDLYIDMGEDTMFLLHSTHVGAYVLSRFPAAVISRFVSPTRVISVCLGVSSLITLCLPSVIPVNIPLLFVLRGLQGLLDGAIFPSVLSVLSCWITEADGGRIYCLTSGGVYLSPAVSALLSGSIMCYVNWNGSLYLFGSLGLTWALLWTLTVYNTPEEHPSMSPAERDLHQKHRAKMSLRSEQLQKDRSVPWRKILTSLPVWSVFVGFFSRSFVNNLVMVAQPQYFSDAFVINIADISFLIMNPHIGLSMFTLLGGMIVDKLIKMGLSPTVTRKAMFTCGHLTEGLCMMGLHFVDDWRTAITLISVGVSVGGLAESAVLPVPADLSPKHAGVILGIGTSGAVGAFLSTVTASVLCGNNQGLAGWQKLFMVAGLLSSSSVLFYNLWAQSKLQPWANETDSIALETDQSITLASETDRLLPESTKCTTFHTSENNELQ